MKLLAVIITVAVFLSLAFARKEQMKNSSANSTQNVEIIRNGSQPSQKGAAEIFTGSVRVDMLFQPQEYAADHAARG